MVWFMCGECGDSIKKPKLTTHFYNCSSHNFSCIDCSCVFDRLTAQKHAQCVTEHEKYALGATKPGGFAANGFKSPDPGTSLQKAHEAIGLEYLSTRAPWKCSVCNIGCTSQETLMAHAAGLKHKRRAKAAAAASNGDVATVVSTPAEGTPADEKLASTSQAEPVTDKDTSAEDKPVKAKKSKKNPDTELSTSKEESAEEKPEKTKKSKKKGLHAALKEAEKFAKLVKGVSKKLSSKGEVTEKKLRALACEKLALDTEADELEDDLLNAIRQQLSDQGVCRVEGNKLLPAA